MVNAPDPLMLSHPFHTVLLKSGFQFQGPCPKPCAEINGFYSTANERESLHLEIEDSRFKLCYWQADGKGCSYEGQGSGEFANALIAARTL
jgi:hypothetical protein